MTDSTKIIMYNSLSYIQCSLYFIYLRCVLFLNVLDHIIFSNILEENNNTNDNLHYNSRLNNNHVPVRNNFNSENNFSIFDINRKNLLSTHTVSQINNMEELLFSDQ